MITIYTLSDLQEILSILDEYHRMVDEMEIYHDSRSLILQSSKKYLRPDLPKEKERIPMKFSLPEVRTDASKILACFVDVKIEEDYCGICMNWSDYRGFHKSRCCKNSICIGCFVTLMYSNIMRCPYCRHEPLTILHENEVLAT